MYIYIWTEIERETKTETEGDKGNTKQLMVGSMLKLIYYEEIVAVWWKWIDCYSLYVIIAKPLFELKGSEKLLHLIVLCLSCYVAQTMVL